MREARRQPPIGNLAKWRDKFGLTQDDLAALLEVTQPQVSRYESGKDQMTIPVLHALAEALGILPEDFWKDPGAPRNELEEALALAAKADEARQKDVVRVVRAMLAA